MDVPILGKIAFANEINNPPRNFIILLINESSTDTLQGDLVILVKGSIGRCQYSA